MGLGLCWKYSSGRCQHEAGTGSTNAGAITYREVVESWIQGSSRDRAQGLDKGVVPFIESFKIGDLLLFLNEGAYYFVVLVIIIDWS